jgi:hypothetical protein
MWVIIVVFGVGILLYWRSQDLRGGYEYANRMAAPLRSRLLPIPSYYRELLQKYFHYYKVLSPENQRKFEQKLCHFIYRKQFIPRGMKEIPLEMVVFIAAVAVQLTFGLPSVYLQHFNKILIYPDDYYSRITKRYHKGEVNPAFGIIVLSWTHFMEGFIDHKNAINLGLHEMAHALRLENIIRNEEYAFFDAELMLRMDEWCHRVCTDEQTLSATFFRPYACTNTHEFFSVAVENFFEKSVQFRTEMPELYTIMTRLLNQDPIQLNTKPELQ